MSVSQFAPIKPTGQLDARSFGNDINVDKIILCFVFIRFILKSHACHYVYVITYVILTT